MFRALYAAWLLAFWRFVQFCGGPRHASYCYARFEAWRAREFLRLWASGKL
jgi:hypothetical protein